MKKVLPDQLYHYTGIEGLKGIIENKTLWASHYKYLNDSEEIVHFRETLNKLLYPVIGPGLHALIKQAPENQIIVDEAGGMEKSIIEVTNGITKSMYDVTFGFNGEEPFAEPFITSFCSHISENNAKHGLLSQWRGYGANGGYALIFDTSALQNLLIAEGTTYGYRLYMGDVVYSDESESFIMEEMKEDISALSNAYKKFFEEPDNLENLYESYDAFLSCVCRYKHWGFSEEKEVRIVAIPIASQIKKLAGEQGVSAPEKPIKHYIRGGIAIPYIAMFEGVEPDKKVPFPLKHIIVGPHPEKDKRKRSIEIMLEQNKIEATVAVSEIPYLGK